MYQAGVSNKSILVGVISMFELKDFAAAPSTPRKPQRTFPLQLKNFDLSKDPHTMTGLDISEPNSPPITVYLRPRRDVKGSNARPEISNFVLDAVKIAEASENQEQIDMAKADPLSKLFTDPGGVILVEGSYLDEVTGHLSASWLRLLQRKSDVATIYKKIWARVNKPYHRENGGKLTASIDIVHPEQRVQANDLKELHTFIMDIVGRSSGGETFVVIKLKSSTEAHAPIVRVVHAERKADPYGEGYVWDTPEAVVERFWASFDAKWMDGLNEAILTGSVIAEVYAGARFYFVKEGLEQTAKRGEDHYSKFVLKDQDEHGFLKCTVVLRNHSNTETEKFPTGCYPVLPYDDRPVHLSFL